MHSLRIMISCMLVSRSVCLMNSPPNINTKMTSTATSRRTFLPTLGTGILGAILATPLTSQAAIDVNNAASGDFQSYKGLFPTIAAKIIKRGPFKDAEEMYAAMDSDAEVDRLKQYEKEFKFGKVEPGGDRGTGKRSI